MARAQPGTATAEYFVCVGDQPELDFGGGRNPDGLGFAAFGRVVEGMDVIRALHARGEADQYLARPIRVRSVRRVARDGDGRRLSVPARLTPEQRRGIRRRDGGIRNRNFRTLRVYP